MSRGRCPGCGAEDASCKKIRTHMNSCSKVIELYQTNPEAVIDPEEEFVRHREYLESEEGQAAREARRLAVRDDLREAGRRAQARQSARWSK